MFNYFFLLLFLWLRKNSYICISFKIHSIMTTIDLNTVPYSVDPVTKVISVSEKHVPFATTYKVISTTRVTKVFELSHSTGSEFDPNTKWVYKNGGLVLEVCNDTKMTTIASSNYLKTKLRN